MKNMAAKPATTNLSGLLVSKQAQSQLVERLCKASQHCAGNQLFQFQQLAMNEEQRFKSVVDKHFN
jgi:hypothetical protein